MEQVCCFLPHFYTNPAPVTDIRTYFKLENSYYDETGKSVESDFFRVLIGLCLVYAYVLIMIGGFECIQQKVNY